MFLHPDQRVKEKLNCLSSVLSNTVASFGGQVLEQQSSVRFLFNPFFLWKESPAQGKHLSLRHENFLRPTRTSVLDCCSPLQPLSPIACFLLVESSPTQNGSFLRNVNLSGHIMCPCAPEDTIIMCPLRVTCSPSTRLDTKIT